MSIFRGVTVGTTLTLDKGKWSRELRESKAELRAWKDTAERTGRGVSNALKSVAKVGAVAIGAGLVGAIAAGTSELMDMQKASAQTAAVLKSTGHAANVNQKHVEALSGALLKKSGVDDQVIQSGENMLLTFTRIRNETGKGNKVFDDATKTVLDMSVAMGTDMPKASILVGKALNDPLKGITALTRVGVTFDDQQKKQIKTMVAHNNVIGAQKVVLKELRKEFGGSAEAYGNTFAGRLGKVKEEFKGVAALIVSKFIPALEGGMNQARLMIEGIDDWAHSRQGAEFIDDLAEGARTMAHVLGEGAKEVGHFIGVMIRYKDVTLAATAAVVAFEVTEKIATFIKAGYAAVNIAATSLTAYKLSTEGATFAQWAFNRAIMANPIGAIAGVVAIAVGALVSWKLSSDDAASASERAAASAKHHLDAMRKVEDAKLATRSASFGYIDAVKQEGEARSAVLKLERDGKKGTKAYRDAQYEAARATAQREAAESSLTGTMRTRKAASEDLRKSIAQDVQVHDDLGRSVQDAQRYMGALKDGSINYTYAWAHLTKVLKENGYAHVETEAQAREALAKMAADRETVNKRIIAGQNQLRDLTARSQSDIRFLLKNGANVTPDMRKYTVGVIENLHRAGVLTDSETAKIRTRLQNGLDNVRPAARNMGANFQSAISHAFGGLKIPAISVPIKAAIHFLTGGHGKTGDGSLMDMLLGYTGAGSVGVPKGVDPDVGRAVALGQRDGLVVTSMLRPGAISSTGNVSDHATGHAVDMAGGASAMMRFAREANHLRGVKQVIYSPLGWARNGGGFSAIPANAGTVLRDHYKHVHVSMYQRGTPGMVPGFGDGDTVPAMLEPGEGIINKNATAALGGSQFIKWANTKWPRFATGGTAGGAHAIQPGTSTAHSIMTGAAGASIEDAQVRADRPVWYLQKLLRKDEDSLTQTFTNAATLRGSVTTLQKQLARNADAVKAAKAKQKKAKAGSAERKRIDAQLKALDAEHDQIADHLKKNREALAAMPERRQSLSDEIVALRAEIRDKIQSGSDTTGAKIDPETGEVIDPGTGTGIDDTSPKATFADLMAQLNSVATSLNQAFQNESGNAFRKVSVDQLNMRFETPVAPAAAMAAMQHELQAQVG